MYSRNDLVKGTCACVHTVGFQLSFRLVDDSKNSVHHRHASEAGTRYFVNTRRSTKQCSETNIFYDFYARIEILRIYGGQRQPEMLSSALCAKRGFRSPCYVLLFH